MLIQKGGISRQIDEKMLPIYKSKGYVVVEQAEAPATADPKAGAKDGKNSK